MTDSVSSYLLATLLILASAIATGHILLSKQDVRAAIGWTAVVWMVPGVGVLLYLLLGVNRVRRGAERRRRERLGIQSADRSQAAEPELLACDPEAPPRFAAHARLGRALTGMPLTAGNRLEPLINGDEAYPAMLEAIERAERSVALSTYIYQWDEVGRQFAAALEQAQARGVEVCVLIDAMGSLLAHLPLRRHGIAVRAFNPPTPAHLALLNLRTHRKILVIDGRCAFTGGMNIRDIHQRAGRKPLASQDIMFRIEGPVVRQLVQLFAEDWRFAGGSPLRGEAWYHETSEETASGAVVRTVPDGPEEELSFVGWIFESALSVARRSVRITTPYFLPDLGLLSALSQTALRGVEIDILIPARSNYFVVGWASQALFLNLARYGVRLHLSPPPLDHSKIIVVDDYWAMIGSSNWDARSFRLNFELNLEIFNTAMARRLGRLLDARIATARQVTFTELEQRPLALRLRDRAAWLMSPYL